MARVRTPESIAQMAKFDGEFWEWEENRNKYTGISPRHGTNNWAVKDSTGKTHLVNTLEEALNIRGQNDR